MPMPPSKRARTSTGERVGDGRIERGNEEQHRCANQNGFSSITISQHARNGRTQNAPHKRRTGKPALHQFTERKLPVDEINRARDHRGIKPEQQASQRCNHTHERQVTDAAFTP